MEYCLLLPLLLLGLLQLIHDPRCAAAMTRVHHSHHSHHAHMAPMALAEKEEQPPADTEAAEAPMVRPRPYGYLLGDYLWPPATCRSG